MPALRSGVDLSELEFFGQDIFHCLDLRVHVVALILNIFSGKPMLLLSLAHDPAFLHWALDVHGCDHLSLHVREKYLWYISIYVLQQAHE